MKVCTRCCREFPNTNEYFKTHKRGVLRNECRTCFNKKKEKRKNNYYLEWMNTVLPSHLKMDKLGCIRCGYDNSISAIELHYSDRTKDESDLILRIKSTNPFGRRAPLILAEIKKCSILCSNCHNEEHSGGKIYVRKRKNL